MRAIYFKITNDLFFYNKKTLILFCALPFITSLITLTINGNKISIIDFFLPICFLISGALVISQIIKAKDLKFQKFSSDKNVYVLSDKKYKKQCYNESINRISQNEITIDNLHINGDKEILKFLTNFNLSFIEKLKKSITFKRFEDYLITNDSNKTSGNLFFTLYKNSLLKIINDFIIETDYLINTSDAVNQQFIHELTKLENLKFDSIKGLHYEDKFVINFFKKIKKSSVAKDNISKEIFINEISKINSLISQSNDHLINNRKELINYLENNISKDFFIKENSKIQNLISQSNDQLINNKKEFITYLENYITKDLFIQENQKTNHLISSFKERTLKKNKEILSILRKHEDKIEQENIIQELKKNIKPIKINKISNYQFYKILEKISIDVLKVKLTKNNIEELRSFVGIFFKSDIESKFQYEPKIKQLSFINLDNSTDFIFSIKYLINSNLIEKNMSRNMQNLDKVIVENAYDTTAKNRAEIFRNNLKLINFAPEKQRNIDYILQDLKIKIK